MKPPSFRTINHFTFDTYLFTGSGCFPRNCPRYIAHNFCDNCIRCTKIKEDDAYRNFTHILIKEIT